MTMAEYVLETRHLGIRFGGLKAVDDVNIQIKKNQIYGLIGPNGAGKTTVFNLVTGVYAPTEGEIYLDGQWIVGLSQEKINHMGIARTFQNIRLLNQKLHNFLARLDFLLNYKHPDKSDKTAVQILVP